MRLRVMRRREVCTAEAVLDAGSTLASVLLDASPDACEKYCRVRNKAAEACQRQ